MSCKWIGGCKVPTPDEFCTLHKKAMGIEKPKKEAKPIPTMSAKKKEAQPKEIAEKKALTVFYNEQLNVMPHGCMECGDELFKSQIINIRTPIAHLLCKRTFKSVATDPNNVIFLCQLHHGRFDNSLERYMKEAKTAQYIKDKVQLLLPKLTDTELGKVSEFLLTTP